MAFIAPSKDVRHMLGYAQSPKQHTGQVLDRRSQVAICTYTAQEASC